MEENKVVDINEVTVVTENEPETEILTPEEPVAETTVQPEEKSQDDILKEVEDEIDALELDKKDIKAVDADFTQIKVEKFEDAPVEAIAKIASVYDKLQVPEGQEEPKLNLIVELGDQSVYFLNKAKEHEVPEDMLSTWLYGIVVDFGQACTVQAFTAINEKIEKITNKINDSGLANTAATDSYTGLVQRFKDGIEKAEDPEIKAQMEHRLACLQDSEKAEYIFNYYKTNHSALNPTKLLKNRKHNHDTITKMLNKIGISKLDSSVVFTAAQELGLPLYPIYAVENALAKINISDKGNVLFLFYFLLNLANAISARKAKKETEFTKQIINNFVSLITYLDKALNEYIKEKEANRLNRLQSKGKPKKRK